MRIGGKIDDLYKTGIVPLNGEIEAKDKQLDNIIKEEEDRQREKC